MTLNNIKEPSSDSGSTPVHRNRKKKTNGSTKLNSPDDESLSHFSSFAVASFASLSNNLSNGIANTFDHWQILLIGQGLSLAMAVINASSSELNITCNLSSPLLLLFFSYMLLSMHFIPQLMGHFCKKPKFTQAEREISGIELDELANESAFDTDESPQQKHRLPFTSLPLDVEWHKYFLVTLTDAEANFFTFLAYRYTSLTSVTLLTSLSVIGAMLTSRVILNTTYRCSHYLGVTVCITGITVNVISDLENPNEYDIGPMFAALGGILYGVNATLSEYLVNKCNFQQYLGVSGFYGMIICCFQLLLFDLDSIRPFFDGSSTCDIPAYTSLVIIFSITNYVKFMGDSYFLIMSEATLLNLSLLTVDFYSALYQIFAEQIMPMYTFFIAVLLAVTGIIIYESVPSPNDHGPSLEESVNMGNFNVELKGLPKQSIYETSALRELT